MTNQFRPWTDEHDALLRARYVPDGLKACAAALTRTEGAVSQRALRLGLKAKGTPEFRARMQVARAAVLEKRVLGSEFSTTIV
jgi:hypothetical protein